MRARPRLCRAPPPCPQQVFAEFNPTPIAAASLGQVHLAKLDSGEQVVVKVQRPGLKELFDIDLKNIRCVGSFGTRIRPPGPWHVVRAISMSRMGAEAAWLLRGSASRPPACAPPRPTAQRARGVAAEGRPQD